MELGASFDIIGSVFFRLIVFGFWDNFLQKRPVVVYSPVLLPVALMYLLPADDEIPLY